MELVVVGLNHKTAPVAVREGLALPREAALRRLPALCREAGAAEAAVVSTCNRVEAYAAGAAPEALERFLAGLHPSPPPDFEAHLYRHQGRAAARHLFAVAAGLDALVVGETEILGQVKEAYQVAVEAGTAGRVLHAAFQRALRAAKLAHATTRLGERRVSVGSVAAEFAEKIFGTTSGQAVLVVGAGEMAEAVLRALQEGGARDLTVANRTAERARDLAARFGGRTTPFDRLPDALSAADIVLTCTGAEAYLFGPAEAAAALRARRHRPILLIDISVPRNIDPAAGGLDHVYLFNIDDLEAVVKSNLEEREREVERCRPLIEAEVESLAKQLGEGDLGPLIARMRETYQRVGEAELARVLERMQGLSPAQRAELEDGMRRMVGRFVHDQTLAIKEWARNGGQTHASAVLERLIAESAGEMSRLLQDGKSELQNPQSRQ